MTALCGAVCCSDGVLTVGSLAPQCETHIRLARGVGRRARQAASGGLVVPLSRFSAIRLFAVFMIFLL
jgi:hypothetical protein